MINQQLAREAAIEASNTLAVGDFISERSESEPDVTTFLFESKLKGYVGWRWAVSIYQPEAQQPTISEVNLVAGEDSVLAPKWVPWSERLADYKALQAALEQQAAEEAAAAAENADASENIDDENESLDNTELAEDETDDGFEEVEELSEEEVELASASSDQNAESAEGETGDAGDNPPSFFRIFRRNKKRK